MSDEETKGRDSLGIVPVEEMGLATPSKGGRELWDKLVNNYLLLYDSRPGVMAVWTVLAELMLAGGAGLLFLSGWWGVLMLLGGIARWGDHKARASIPGRIADAETATTVATKKADDMEEIATELAFSSQQALNLYLYNFLVGFGVNTAPLRITLFVPSNDGSELLIGARWAEVGSWCNFDLRSYPANKGFIGKAWNEKYAESGVLPDPESEPDAYRQAHIDVDYEEHVDELSMPSRCYYCFRIGRLVATEPGFVVSIESTNTRLLGIKKIRDSLQAPSPKLLMLEQLLPAMQALRRLDSYTA